MQSTFSDICLDRTQKEASIESYGDIMIPLQKETISEGDVAIENFACTCIGNVRSDFVLCSLSGREVPRTGQTMIEWVDFSWDNARSSLLKSHAEMLVYSSSDPIHVAVDVSYNAGECGVSPPETGVAVVSWQVSDDQWPLRWRTDYEISKQVFSRFMEGQSESYMETKQKNHCDIFVAPSRIRGAGNGVFAGRNFDENSALVSP